MIGSAFVTYIQTVDDVQALISGRIYPEYVFERDKVYPLLAYNGKNVHSPIVSGGGTIGITYCDLIIGAVGTTYKQSDQLAEAIMDELNGTNGTWGDTIVQGCFLAADGVTDEIVTDQTSEAITYYVKELTFNLVYQ